MLIVFCIKNCSDYFEVCNTKYMRHATHTLSVWKLYEILIFLHQCVNYILQKIKTELKIMHVLIAICTLLVGVEVSRAFIDTSNYKIIIDQRRENFTYWDAQCRGELN